MGFRKGTENKCGTSGAAKPPSCPLKYRRDHPKHTRHADKQAKPPYRDTDGRQRQNGRKKAIQKYVYEHLHRCFFLHVYTFSFNQIRNVLHS